MILALDAGNTALTFGFFREARLVRKGRVLHADAGRSLAKWLQKAEREPFDICLSSVVPSITKLVKRSLADKPGVRLFIAGENLPVPIKHKYRSIKKLGMDRQVNVFGALRMYKPPLLIIDYGTAVTMDYVSKSGVFLGGLIIPGPELSFKALVNRAAMISSSLRLPKKAGAFLGRSTRDCMASGVLEGYGAMTDGLIERFRARFGGGFKVIATGGFVTHLKPFTRHLYVSDPDLTLRSLYFLHKETSQRKRK